MKQETWLSRVKMDGNIGNPALLLVHAFSAVAPSPLSYFKVISISRQEFVWMKKGNRET